VRDKTLDIFLMVLFGIGGIAILILAWTRPMSLAERILTTSIGSIGISWALVRAVILLLMRAKISVAKNPDHLRLRKPG
jgi:hypothetical protein